MIKECREDSRREGAKEESEMRFLQGAVRKHKVQTVRVGDKGEWICRVKWSAAISGGKQANFSHRAPSKCRDNKRDKTRYKLQ